MSKALRCEAAVSGLILGSKMHLRLRGQVSAPRLVFFIRIVRRFDQTSPPSVGGLLEALILASDYGQLQCLLWNQATCNYNSFDVNDTRSKKIRL